MFHAVYDAHFYLTSFHFGTFDNIPSIVIENVMSVENNEISIVGYVLHKLLDL